MIKGMEVKYEFEYILSSGNLVWKKGSSFFEKDMVYTYKSMGI